MCPNKPRLNLHINRVCTKCIKETKLIQINFLKKKNKTNINEKITLSIILQYFLFLFRINWWSRRSGVPEPRDLPIMNSRSRESHEMRSSSYYGFVVLTIYFFWLFYIYFPNVFPFLWVYTYQSSNYWNVDSKCFWCLSFLFSHSLHCLRL